jgi:hypothetical protein
MRDQPKTMQRDHGELRESAGGPQASQTGRVNLPLRFVTAAWRQDVTDSAAGLGLPKKSRKLGNLRQKRHSRPLATLDWYLRSGNMTQFDDNSINGIDAVGADAAGEYLSF